MEKQRTTPTSSQDLFETSSASEPSESSVDTSKDLFASSLDSTSSRCNSSKDLFASSADNTSSRCNSSKDLFASSADNTSSRCNSSKDLFASSADSTSSRCNSSKDLFASSADSTSSICKRSPTYSQSLTAASASTGKDYLSSMEWMTVEEGSGFKYFPDLSVSTLEGTSTFDSACLPICPLPASDVHNGCGSELSVPDLLMRTMNSEDDYFPLPIRKAFSCPQLYMYFKKE